MAIVKDLARPHIPADPNYSSVNRTVHGSPIGELTPLYRGEIVLSETTGARFVALGITNRNWADLSSVSMGGPTIGPYALFQADFRNNALPASVTFSRASKGVYFDSTGTLIEADTDMPRFDHNPITLSSLGLLIEPTTQNRIPNPRLIGGTVGQIESGGALPTNWNLWNQAGLNGIFVEGFGSEDGIPYIDLRLQGTAANSTAIRFYQNVVSSHFWSVSVEETHAYSLYLRSLSGSMNGISSVSIVFDEYDASNGWLYSRSFSVDSFSASRLKENKKSFVHTITDTNAAKMTASIRFSVQSETSINFAFRLGLPHGQLGSETLSPPLPPSGTVALSTRVADVVALSAANGMYDVLVQDTEGGEWRPDEVVTEGTYIITPRAGKWHVRRVRLYPQGTAVMYPGWAVAA
jgi:hypothetical protein